MAYSGTEEKTGENLIRLSVPDMDCPVEEGEIRAELEKISGISSIAADTARRTLEVKTDSVPDEDILAALERAGHPGKILPGSPENGSEQIVILVPEMDCAVEAGEIEEALSSHPEIPDGVFDTRRRRSRSRWRATARLRFSMSSAAPDTQRSSLSGSRLTRSRPQFHGRNSALRWCLPSRLS